MSFNPLIKAVHTDLYQLTMAYSRFMEGKRDDHASFEVFFRQGPFDGEFVVFAGADEVYHFVQNFKFDETDIQYLKAVMGDDKAPAFWDWLRSVDCSSVTITSVAQGEIVFANTPLLKIQGPLSIVQILETMILNLVNFASLVTTNALRMRIAGDSSSSAPKQYFEFGLRRAQGPDGAYSASKYAMIVFDGTSNVLVGKNHGVRVVGTTSHSHIQSFFGMRSFEREVKDIMIRKNGTEEFVRFNGFVLDAQAIVVGLLGGSSNHNQSELAAYASYAASFPDRFVALLDTYHTTSSGIINFIIIWLALKCIGYKAIGVRLDSGDLAQLSIECRQTMIKFDTALNLSSELSRSVIIASNDLDEAKLLRMCVNHEIDIFAIGTNLVTCAAQPALGCVCKLTELNGVSSMKLSQDAKKTTIPGNKSVYRLYSSDGQAIMDVITREHEAPPSPNMVCECIEPSNPSTLICVTPSGVKPLLQNLWPHGSPASIQVSKAACFSSYTSIPKDVTRSVNPVHYRVCLSVALYRHLEETKLSIAHP